MERQPYLKTNTENEAVQGLKFVTRHARHAGADPYQWKWVLLGLHGALQSLMVLALGHGSGLRVLKKGIEEEWLKAYRSGGPYPEEKLDLFLNLFGKIQSKEMLFYVHSQRLVPTSSQRSSIRKLNALRNRFIHYLPGTWLIEIAGLPQICLDGLAIGEFLACESNNISWSTIPVKSVRRVFHGSKRVLEARAADEQPGTWR